MRPAAMHRQWSAYGTPTIPEYAGDGGVRYGHANHSPLRSRAWSPVAGPGSQRPLVGYPGGHGETGFPAGSTSRAPQSPAVLERFCGSGGPAPRAIRTIGHGVHPHSRSASPGLPPGRMASRGVPMCLRSHSGAYHSALRYRIQRSIGRNCSDPVIGPTRHASRPSGSRAARSPGACSKASSPETPAAHSHRHQA
jgi:hypothetical protein